MDYKYSKFRNKENIPSNDIKNILLNNDNCSKYEIPSPLYKDKIILEHEINKSLRSMNQLNSINISKNQEIYSKSSNISKGQSDDNNNIVYKNVQDIQRIKDEIENKKSIKKDKKDKKEKNKSNPPKIQEFSISDDLEDDEEDQSNYYNRRGDLQKDNQEKDKQIFYNDIDEEDEGEDDSIKHIQDKDLDSSRERKIKNDLEKEVKNSGAKLTEETISTRIKLLKKK